MKAVAPLGNCKFYWNLDRKPARTQCPIFPQRNLAVKWSRFTSKTAAQNHNVNMLKSHVISDSVNVNSKYSLIIQVDDKLFSTRKNATIQCCLMQNPILNESCFRGIWESTILWWILMRISPQIGGEHIDWKTQQTEKLFNVLQNGPILLRSP